MKIIYTLTTGHHWMDHFWDVYPLTSEQSLCRTAEHSPQYPVCFTQSSGERNHLRQVSIGNVNNFSHYLGKPVAISMHFASRQHFLN